MTKLNTALNGSENTRRKILITSNSIIEYLCSSSDGDCVLKNVVWMGPQVLCTLYQMRSIVAH